jgi:hypothetical protein
MMSVGPSLLEHQHLPSFKGKAQPLSFKTQLGNNTWCNQSGYPKNNPKFCHQRVSLHHKTKISLLHLPPSLYGTHRQCQGTMQLHDLLEELRPITSIITLHHHHHHHHHHINSTFTDRDPAPPQN